MEIFQSYVSLPEGIWPGPGGWSPTTHYSDRASRESQTKQRQTRSLPMGVARTRLATCQGGRRWVRPGPQSKDGTPPKRDIYFLDIGNGVCFGFMYVVATASLGSSDNTYVYILCIYIYYIYSIAKQL
jgi:hypothetical protein